MSKILLSALRGGQVQWQVKIGSFVYVDDLISVSGINKTIDFSGSFLGSSVTIELLQDRSGIAVNDDVLVSLVDLVTDDKVDIWKGTVEQITTSEKISVTAHGSLSKIDENVSINSPQGKTPIQILKQIVDAAVPSMDAAVPTQLFDLFDRSAVRLAPKMSTLGGLNGFVTAESTTIEGHFRYSGSSVINPVPAYTHTTAIGKDDVWELNYAFSDPSLSIFQRPKNPLSWHHNNLHLVTTCKMGTDGAFSGNSYWPLGEGYYQSTYFSVGGLSAANTPIGPFTTTGNLDNLQEVSVHYVRTNAFGNSVNRRTKVECATANETYTSWSDAAQDDWGFHYNRTPDATEKNEYSYEEQMAVNDGSCFKFTDANGTTDEHVGREQPTYWGMFDIKYHIQDWHTVFDYVQTPSEFPVQYITQQNIQLKTVQSEPLTWSNASEACLLGSYGVYESATGASYASTCPEEGAVFPVILNKDFIESWNFQQFNYLPKNLNIQIRDPWGNDFEVKTSFSDEDAADEQNITLMQGQLFRDTRPVKLGTNTYSYALGSNSWKGNPGINATTLTGIAANGTNGLTISHIEDITHTKGCSLLLQDGTVKSLSENYTSAPTKLTSYEMRDEDNIGREHFIKDGSLTIGGGKLPQQEAPYIDFYPAMSLKKAVQRCFRDSRRPSYTCRASMVFATLNPGDVVVLDYTEFSTDKYLALVLSVQLSSDSTGVTLTVCPMIPLTEVNAQYWNIQAINKILSNEDVVDYRAPYPGLIPDEPEPIQPIITGTEITWDSTSIYRGCTELMAGGNTISIDPSTIDQTKSLVVKMNGQVYQSSEYVSETVPNILSPANGFENSTQTGYTARANNIWVNGVFIVQSSNTKCYVYIDDALAANIPSDLQIFYNAEVTYD